MILYQKEVVALKVLFYRYKNICEPDVIAAFKELGLTVAEMEHKAHTFKESVLSISEYLQHYPVDFVFSINFFPALSEVCNVFHLRYLSWSADCPVFEYYTPSVKNIWNRIFLFDREQYNKISPLNPDRVFHLPLAANPVSKERLFRNTPTSVFSKYRSDVSFVGSLYTEMCPYDKISGIPDYLKGYLDGLMSAQEKVYGGYFIDALLTDNIIAECKKYIPDFYQPFPGSCLTDQEILSSLYLDAKISANDRLSTMRLLGSYFCVDLYTGSSTSDLPMVRNKGLANTFTEMPLVFHESRINLNITSKSIRSGLPLRIFDILSCQGFVLTNYQSEIDNCFDIGADLEVYSSTDELLEKSRYYLTHENERAEIAYHGWETLKKYHTYMHRLTEMLTKAFL